MARRHCAGSERNSRARSPRPGQEAVNPVRLSLHRCDELRGIWFGNFIWIIKMRFDLHQTVKKFAAQCAQFVAEPAREPMRCCL